MKHQSENVIPFQQFVHKYDHWGNILENHSDYRSISQNHLSIKHYTNSLSKKRLLKLWESFRMQVQIAPQLPNVIERVVYRNVFEDIKATLLECYQEDSEEPFHLNSLKQWLKRVKDRAGELEKEEDAFYWEEIIKYLDTCVKFDVLRDSNN